MEKVNMHNEQKGHWAPPQRWKTRLYKLFGLTAPDRWIRHEKKP
jgi:hypothetical protein